VSAPWRSRSRRQRGAALLYVLFLLVLTTTAGMLLSTALSIDLRLRKEESLRVRVAPLLDSAVAEAMAALAVDPGARGFEAHPFAAGEIESDVLVLDATRREIHARARYGPVERIVVVEVELGPGGPRVLSWRRDR
jgi:hypothetical protein